MKRFHEITLAEDSAFSTEDGISLLKKGQIVRVYEGEEEEAEEEKEEEETEDEEKSKEEGKK